VGTACHVKGAREIRDAFKKTLGIDEDSDTDSDMLFTVEEVACLGCCMIAPAVRIDDVIYGDLTPEGVGSIISDFLKEKRTDSKRSLASEASANSAEMRICLCSSCSAAGAAKVADELIAVADEFSLSATLKKVACTGKSFAAPIMELRLSDGTSFTYGSLTPESARIAILRHLKPDSIVSQFTARAYSLLDSLLGGGASDTADPVRFLADAGSGASLSVCSCDSEIVTMNAGEISPLNIDEYIASGGFNALRRLVDELSPDMVLDEIEHSGLRGRGGGGFPVSDKWRSVKNNKKKIKYLVCNGDEGDPGAFMDRMILESFPFKVIEGIAIAALVIGAEEAIIYIRSEYPLAAENARKAIAICESRGLLGENTADTGKTLSVRVVEGAGAFVCGEETALIAALEGRRGMPSPRPPYPAEFGFRGAPTLVNNVETLASIPWIISRGSAKFAKIGTKKSRGSKTFALAGRVRRGGLVEVPMGTTLGEIIYDIGGGIQNDVRAKAVLVGGPSGACVPERLFDTPIDYERLTELGGMMGSGGLVVLDATDCMVDIARYFLSFTQDESCGKCVFCRVGSKRLLEILEDLCEGRGRKGDVVLLLDFGENVR
jgi:NADH-quinone oxidoreductase subunit F